MLCVRVEVLLVPRESCVAFVREKFGVGAWAEFVFVGMVNEMKAGGYMSEMCVGYGAVRTFDDVCLSRRVVVGRVLRGVGVAQTEPSLLSCSGWHTGSDHFDNAGL